jgi:cytochrome c peroxidase
VKGLVRAAVVIYLGVVAATIGGGQPVLARSDASLDFFARNDSGVVRTLDENGRLDLNNPFFKDLGTNGRSCFSCHRPADGWTITPQSVQARFDETDGLDPIFRPNDGSNCAGSDVSTVDARRQAYSMLLTRGLIRVSIDVPAGAEFFVDHVDDPYGCGGPLTTVSMYRRPLPATNLRFLSAVMWDGRESSASTTILEDLAKQADDATLGHAQASVHLTTEEARQIVAFETGLSTAQRVDNEAGSLRANGANGGPAALSRQPFFIGINDPIGLNPTGAAFEPRAFTLFDAWAQLNESRRNPVVMARAAIARGQELFNTRKIVLTGIAGLNGETFSNGATLPSTFTGTCTTCHDTPNAGNHSVKAPLNIGLTDESRRTPDMPLYTLVRISNGDTMTTTDPGRAMVTGKWNDIGKFKGPVLRALAARAPYFHNGSAATLSEVLDFYETRFNLGLTDRERADLIAFLRAL